MIRRASTIDLPRHFDVYDGLTRVGAIIETADGFEACNADGEYLGHFRRLQEAVRAIPSGASARRPSLQTGAEAHAMGGAV
ncbi:hypothetical protein EZH22_05955 [Xanthobacter dioxanivorans]|uniref:Uncharacterized protein n=1 Tax=Xanthobacter dioxanivorans TaxID=2528964 RepID=A0A974PRN6_9HYPH|nr:hypothetical protein [Xanthobacter dioxanivorans]QRG07910.1 hypothetical protein EZH22_05955 [Xanthobacter dioxanivorans]